MFKRIERILNSLGLPQSYLKNFKDNALDDDKVAKCFQNGNNLAALALKEVIPLSGHRMRFILTFREQFHETGSKIVGPNKTSASHGSDLSAGSLAGICGGQGDATTDLGTIRVQVSLDEDLTNSPSVQAASSGQGSVEDAGKGSVLDPAVPELSNPSCSSGFEGEQSTCLNSMDDKGSTDDSDASMHSLDAFQSSGTETEESLISSISSARSAETVDLEKVTTVNKGQDVKIIELTRKVDEAAVKVAMADAQNFYSDQMKTARESKSWYPAEEFKEINDRVLEGTVRRVTEEAKLTQAQVEQLRQSLQGLYSRFKEENDSFIPKDSHAIGIDLGTTRSCVGIYVNGKVEIIQENEKFTIPSCVYYDEGNMTATGRAALDGAFRSPENFIFDVKRLIGRSWNDPVVQDDTKQWNFNVVQVNGQLRIKCRAGRLRPEEVSAQVLAHLKSLAEKHLGQKVTSAVVTVPAYFNEGQRQATKDAAKMAGLSAKILTEPVAAAIAYRLDRAGDLNKKVLVFDLGGGTFDVAVLTISGPNIEVKTINGDTPLGGEDFDKLMVQHVLNKVKGNTGRDLLEGQGTSNLEIVKKTNSVLRRLIVECERQKRDLSTAKMVHIRLEEVGWNLDETMTQEEFEGLINPHLEKCLAIVKTALKDAKMSKNDIHDVVLVGGSTKIPRVYEMLKDYFNGMQLKHSVNPDQAVAYGAAIQAAIQAATKDGTTQGSGLRNKILVQDCTPSSIGIEDITGDFIVQIPKGSKIPFSHKAFWGSGEDYRTECEFYVYEGECTRADENHFLGKFVFHLPAVRSEEAEMVTTTLIDDEGILWVRAVCLMNGNESCMQIDAYKGRMSEEEMERRRVDIAQRRT